tara:strand:- start:989 stop:1327 length:339 start_codon:yes stop_codon:yes gene_type:complete
MNYDYLLKFESESQANSVLYTKVPTAWSESVSMDEPPVATEWMDKPNYDNIDIIGTIYNPTGEATTNEDGFEVPVMVALDGYHVNIRHNTEASELDAYAVTPTNPRRIWMGD